MFRLDNVLEDWATRYKPLSHDMAAGSKKKTFFRVTMIDEDNYVVRNFNTLSSPCMAYATHIDAELQQNVNRISYRHVIYFLVKQNTAPQKTPHTDETAATEARYETDGMVQDLLAWLFDLKQKASNGDKSFTSPLFSLTDKATREGLRGLQLDTANWATLPVHWNGWQVCGLSIEQIVPRDLCINPEKYITE